MDDWQAKDAHDSYYAAVHALRRRHLGVREEHIGDATLYLGDCLEILPTLNDGDVVVTDPPYGVTNHAWDFRVPADGWMVAPSVVFSVEPFSSELIQTAPQPFKYDLIWAKNTASNLENCSIRPARTHETILLFGRLPYSPQKRRRSWREMQRLNAEQRETMLYANPGSILSFDAVNNRNSERTVHPSQKPVELLEWLIATYTLDDQCVLDPFMGSGSTLVACANLGRRSIGIEKNAEYFEIACQRVNEAYRQPNLFISLSTPTLDAEP